MMDDPIGYFLTWVTYGTWLPGDFRGWVEYQRGWQPPESALELESAASMNEEACRLNHVHVVVSAPHVIPKKIRRDLKAWTTRCLKQHFDSHRENWWAERGSIRFLQNEDHLEAAIIYVTECQ